MLKCNGVIPVKKMNKSKSSLAKKQKEETAALVTYKLENNLYAFNDQ